MDYYHHSNYFSSKDTLMYLLAHVILVAVALINSCGAGSMTIDEAIKNFTSDGSELEGKMTLPGDGFDQILIFKDEATKSIVYGLTKGNCVASSIRKIGPADRNADGIGLPNTGIARPPPPSENETTIGI